MTERQWLGNSNLLDMAQFVSDHASQRKGELFIVACCRRHPMGFSNKLNRKAIVAVESHADGLLNDQDLHAQRKTMRGKLGHKIMTGCACKPYPVMCAIIVMELAHENVPEQIAQCNLYRDIFGNPFSPVALDPRWLTSSVVDLATAIYDERAFDRIPILADALMDAGCDNNDIIAHCRGDGPHVRGCWVVDLILGKE
jgi:hypothetical protein